MIGCWAYCLLAIAAAFRHGKIRHPISSKANPPAGVSILKPLSGLDECLEDNLRSYFEHEYPEFEILFAVRSGADPAVAVVQRLLLEYPAVDARLIVTGEPPYAHAKVFSLQCMLEQAKYDLIAMADSDVRV